MLVSQLLGTAVHDRAGVRRYLREIEEQFGEWTMAIDDWRDARDFVAALGHVRVQGRRSGVALDQRVGILFEIRDGQLLRFETFLDNPADALRAAGLSPASACATPTRRRFRDPVRGPRRASPGTRAGGRRGR